MIRIEMLPAAFGDCILVEYGDGAETRRILIDAGLKATFAKALKPRLARIGKTVELELLVVTHIDRDHICGILPLLEASPALVKPKDVWFNGRHHLDEDELGAEDGEALGELLERREKDYPWNLAFGGDKVVVPDDGKLPRLRLAGDAFLTLLSPYQENLTALAGRWDDDLLGSWDESPDEGEAPVDPDDDTLGKRPPLASVSVKLARELSELPFKEDGEEPNGSSIAFLFEHDGHRVLFGADAFPTVLVRSLARLSKGRLELDAFKLSHHGSTKNLSPALLEAVDCPRFLISSDGGTFGHPNPETLARILTSEGEKTLFFNYASDYTTVWDDRKLMKEFGYRVEYPTTEAGGVILEL